VPQTEVARCSEQFKVISMRRFSGQTLVHVYSNQEPGPDFELVTPDLEDVYFATIKGVMNPAEPAAEAVLTAKVN